MKIRIRNFEELNRLALCLGQVLKEGDVVALEGEMGAGKTTLVNYIAETMHVKESSQSPTFSLVNIYQGDITINHLDLYRLEREEEIESFEYEDYFYPRNSITFIEWPQRAASYLPRKLMRITIEKVDQETRDFIFHDESLWNDIKRCDIDEDISN